MVETVYDLEVDLYRSRQRTKRPDWDEYFIKIAEAVALRGDCTRRQVGAVVVDGSRRIVSTGYNGSQPSGPSCLAGECPRARSGVEPGSSYDTGPGTCHAVHAEANALLYAGRDGTSGSTLYLTTEPCDGCWRLIHAAGISRVVWPDGIRSLH
ncbi:deoxycytidylate deaminase [Spirillospora sp. NPDC127200]